MPRSLQWCIRLSEAFIGRYVKRRRSLQTRTSCTSTTSHSSESLSVKMSQAWGAWRTELLALIWSVLSFIAMVILLVIFDSRPVFTWNSVTLNAIIAIVSASMKASLTFAMAELIGQWKWILFSRDSRPLMDFERMDMASRGPLGSLRILCRMNGLWRLQLGGLIILLAIGIEPFSQQLLQLQQGIEFTDSPIDREPAARTMGAEKYNKGDWNFTNRTASPKDPSGSEMVTANTRLELAMQTAILGGLSRHREVVNQQVPVQCPTGICSWNQFQTLGVCSRCNDLTSDLKRVNDFGDVFDAAHNKGYEREYAKKDATAFVLPNGHFLMNINECYATSPNCYYFSPFIGSSTAVTSSMTSFGTGDPRKTNRMKDINTLIWSMSVIHLDTEEYSESEWPNVSLGATECAIYYCVKTIETRVDGNIIHENATEATDAVRNPDSWGLRFSLENTAPENVPPDNKNATLEFHKYHSAAQRRELVISFPDNSSKPEYTLYYTAVWSVSQFIQELLSTDLIENDNVTEAISKVLPNDTARYNGVLGNSGMGEPAAADNVWAFDKPDIPGTFATLATSMTNALREPDLTDDLSFSVLGRIGRPTKYYKTQWGWIALHGVAIIGGIYFWWLTVLNTRSPNAVPPWKNSSLAVISRGSTVVEPFKGCDGSVSEMENWARKHRVKISLNNETSTTYTGHDEEEDGVYLMQESNVNDSRARDSR